MPVSNDDLYVVTAGQTLHVGQGAIQLRPVSARASFFSAPGTLTTGSAPLSNAAAAALKMQSSPGTLNTSSLVQSDLTTLTVTETGGSARTNEPVTFGHYFKTGDVPAGASVQAKIGGVPIVTETVHKATHADGSLRHAIITCVVPTLSANGSQTLTLATVQTPPAPTAITKAAILATAFDADVTCIIGGTAWTLSARQLLAASVPLTLDLTWMGGSQCTEYVLGGRLRNGGSTHAHLAAYFHIRAYAGLGRIRCDVVVENGWTFTPGAGRIDYQVSVTVGGALVYSSAAFAHYHHSRWVARGWYGAAIQARCTHDTTYLKAAKAVPAYAAMQPSESCLNRYLQTYTPGSRVNLRADWGEVGYDPQIGPMPEWDAAYVMSNGDARALNGIVSNSFAGASYSYHYRDENTGHPPKITTYPALSIQGPEGGLVAGTGGNPNDCDEGADPAAHQPLIGFMAYLLTGDYFHLEEMIFLSAYNLIWPGSFGNLSYRLVGYQNRGRAWGVRSLAHTVALTPDTHPMRDYLLAELNYNLDHYINQCATPGGSYYNALGVVYDSLANTDYAAWVGDFWVTTAGRLVELGYSNATTFRNWVARWNAGRMGQGALGYGYSAYYGAVYVYPTGGVNGGNPVWSSFGSFQALFNSQIPLIDSTPDTVPPGPNNYLMHAGAYPAEANAYYANFQVALAYSVDAGVAHPDTWRRFEQMGTPDYTSTPLWNIEPRFNPPAAIAALAQNQWYQFPNSNASAIDPCPGNNCPYSGTNGFAAIMDGLSSGVYDTKRDRLVIFGGGHGNYGGNEVIAFSLRTGTWSMLMPPSTDVSLGAPGYYTDGKPVSRHTYHQLQYSPDLDGMMVMGMSAGHPNAQSSNTVDFFSFATNTWQAKSAPTLGLLGYETYDCAYSGRDKDGNLYVHTAFGNGNRIYKFDISTQTWTAGSLLDYGYYANGGMTAAVDTKRNRMYVLGESNPPRYRDLNNLNAAPVAWNGVPSTVNNTSGPGLDYDPVNDRLIAWVGGQTVHVMNCSTLTWSTLTIAPGSASPPANGERVFGRFRYVPSFHGAVVVQTTTGSVFFLKL